MNTASHFGKSHGMTRDMALAGLAKMGLPGRHSLLPAEFAARLSPTVRLMAGANTRLPMTSPSAAPISPCALNLTDADLDTMSDGIHRLLKTQ